MISDVIHLPDGQSFAVQPVFSGFYFKSRETSRPTSLPFGWTVVLNTQDEELSTAGKHDTHNDIHTHGTNGNGLNGHGHDHDHDNSGVDGEADADGLTYAPSLSSVERHNHPRIRSFRKPTLQTDSLFISSMSIPSGCDYKTPASPTRQIAMMLWVTLYWYFHQPEPLPYLRTEASKDTPDDAKPRGDWTISIRRDGVLRGRNVLPKLERMGLVAAFDSAVDSCREGSGDVWGRMFVSKKMFWQIPARLFLFNMHSSATLGHSLPGSPIGSRPGTPQGVSPGVMSPRVLSPGNLSPHLSYTTSSRGSEELDVEHLDGLMPMKTVTTPGILPSGPFHSTSNLPTYYPPCPLIYTTTNNLRHPLRSRPPRMGEVFYSRFVPSVGQYLTFRVASTSPHPVPYTSPMGPNPPPPEQALNLCSLSDTELMRAWLSKPRVSKFWGGFTPDFLTNAVASKHSFPVIGMWDGVPFGYFEIYWVKEDALGRMLGDDAADWDRGLHVLVGEEWARGRVDKWLSSLVHWCLGADYRTMSVCLEPRVDNDRLLQHLQKAGFSRERQIAFPHKQAWLIRMRRENWEGPAL